MAKASGSKRGKARTTRVELRRGRARHGRGQLPSTGPGSLRGLRPRRAVRGTGPEDVRVPKIPAMIQKAIDEMIAKSKRGELTPDEERELEEVLDYLDEQTLLELQRLAESRT